jgi:hypothetical protein
LNGQSRRDINELLIELFGERVVVVDPSIVAILFTDGLNCDMLDEEVEGEDDLTTE